MDKEIVVIDLDGTFLHVNTFHKWMKFVLKEELKRFHLVSVAKIAKIISMRYFNYIDHSQMKHAILKISEYSISEAQIKKFVHSLDKYLNRTIEEVISQESAITILATAAPMQYAKYIKENYHFDYVIATGYTSENNWKENIKEEKKKNLAILLQKHNLPEHISILYTDHYDDLPLMKDAKLTYLIDPSEETRKLSLDTNIVFHIL